MSLNKDTPRICWILTNGRAGTEKPCIALAEALGYSPELKRVSLRFPWSFLPPRLWLFPLKAYGTFQKNFKPPWPQLILSSGRAAAAGGIALKKALQQRGEIPPLVIHLMNPHLDPAKFDGVIAPAHDQVVGPNVISVLGSLHAMSPKKIEEYPSDQNFPFYGFHKPRLAVFIGGKSKHYDFTDVQGEQLVKELKDLVEKGYSLMISPSRRTPKTVLAAMKEAFPNEYVWDGTGKNPYLDMIKAAEGYLVTVDSVAMLSEMASLEKNLYVYSLPSRKKNGRLNLFLQELYDQKYAEVFKPDAVSVSPNQNQLNEMERVLPQIRALCS